MGTVARMTKTLTTFPQKFENWKCSDSLIWTISEIIREKKQRSLDRRGMIAMRMVAKIRKIHRLVLIFLED